MTEKKNSVYNEATVVSCALKEGGEIVTALSAAHRGLCREGGREEGRDRKKE